MLANRVSKAWVAKGTMRVTIGTGVGLELERDVMI